LEKGFKQALYSLPWQSQLPLRFDAPLLVYKKKPFPVDFIATG